MGVLSPNKFSPEQDPNCSLLYPAPFDRRWLNRILEMNNYISRLPFERVSRNPERSKKSVRLAVF